MFSPQFRFCFFIFNILISSSSFAQKITTFQHTYNIPQHQSYASSVVALPDKGFMIAGMTYATNNAVDKILIIRTDSVGRQIWAKTYAGTGAGNNESGVGSGLAAVDMVLSPEGNVVVCTNTFGRTAIYLLKVNLDGIILWSKTFPGGNFFVGATLGLSIANCYTGGYVLTGAANINSTPGELFVVKTDTGGNITWSNLYYQSGIQNTGFKIISSRSGGYLVCGVSNKSGTSNYSVNGNFDILKIDKNGKLLWSKVFTNIILTNSQIWQSAGSIIELPDKSIYLNGTGLNPPGTVGAVLIKMDSSGNLLWSKIYTSTGLTNIYFRSTIYDSLKRTINISCEFETASSTIALYQCGVIKLDSSGKIILGKAFGPSSLPYVESRATGHDFLQLPTGKFVMVQSEYKDPISGWHYFLVKMDSGLNSNNCNASVFLISPSRYPLQYIYSYKDSAVTFNTGTGCQVNDVSITDSLFCAPFVANFGYKSQCPGNQILFLDSSYYKPISWQWDFGDPSSGNNTSTTQNPVHLYSKPGSYKVRLIAGNGSVSDTIFKTVHIGIVLLAAKTDTVICPGTFSTLNAQSPGARYLWYNGDTTQTQKDTAGTYWVRISSDSCTITDTMTVRDLNTIKINLGKDTVICNGDTLTLHTGYTGTTWSTGAQGPAIKVSQPGKYWAFLHNGVCTSSDTIRVGVKQLHIANAGPDTTLCYDQTYTMQGSGGDIYTWLPATYLSSATNPKAQAILPNTENYLLIVKTTSGCIDSASVLLKVRPKLHVQSFALPNPVCYGQNTIIYAVGKGGDSDHYSFAWPRDSAMGDSISKKLYANQWHKVILKDNCTPDSVEDSIYIKVFPAPKAAFDWQPKQYNILKRKVNFLNESTNASRYTWSFGTGDSSSEISPSYIYADTGDFSVKLIAYGNNCPNDTALATIKIISGQVTIFIPNAFTPDGDGINDYFDIKGTNIKSYSCNIYNRWGEHLYSSNVVDDQTGSGLGWDGSFQGNRVPDGVYLYQLDVTDIFGGHHFFNGNVSVLR